MLTPVLVPVVVVLCLAVLFLLYCQGRQERATEELSGHVAHLATQTLQLVRVTGTFPARLDALEAPRVREIDALEDAVSHMIGVANSLRRPAPGLVVDYGPEDDDSKKGGGGVE